MLWPHEPRGLASLLSVSPRSGAPSHYFPLDRQRSTENKTADPYQESAVNTTAAAGMPPEPEPDVRQLEPDRPCAQAA